MSKFFDFCSIIHNWEYRNDNDPSDINYMSNRVTGKSDIRKCKRCGIKQRLISEYYGAISEYYSKKSEWVHADLSESEIRDDKLNKLLR